MRTYRYIMETNPKEITVFSKPECPFCDKTKMFFDEHKIPYKVITLDPSQVSYETQKEWLKSSTGHNTFPFIFVGTTFLGGFMELLRAHRTNALHKMCADIGINMEYEF